LLQGPVTVIDHNTYAGDARIDDVPAGQERLLSYGVDLEMVVDATRNTERDAIMTAKIVKGVLQVKRKSMRSQEYRTENKSDEDRALVIEHPVSYGWKLVDTQAPYETTPTVYRFRGKAVAGKVTTLAVKEEYVHDEGVVISAFDLNTLLMYSRTGEI